MYLVDFQVSMLKDLEMMVVVDGASQTANVNAKTQHMLYVVQANGGTHKVSLGSSKPCLFIVTGVDVSQIK